MIAYQTDHSGVYVGPVQCDLSPLENGVWLVPGGAYTVEPPEFGENQQAVWNGSGWDVIDVPSLPEPDVEDGGEIDPETAVMFARHAAYRAPNGPDSLFFQWQRGDATEQEWLDAVQAVKDAHPYPEPS
jgi:hypothetical protein